jgi:hypothetical protein
MSEVEEDSHGHAMGGGGIPSVQHGIVEANRQGQRYGHYTKHVPSISVEN